MIWFIAVAVPCLLFGKCHHIMNNLYKSTYILYNWIQWNDHTYGTVCYKELRAARRLSLFIDCGFANTKTVNYVSSILKSLCSNFIGLPVIASHPSSQVKGFWSAPSGVDRKPSDSEDELNHKTELIKQICRGFLCESHILTSMD